MKDLDDESVARIAVSSDGRYIVWGTIGHLKGPETFHMLDTTSGNVVLSFDSSTETSRSAFSMLFSPDEKYLLCGNNYGEIVVYDMAKGGKIDAVLSASYAGSINAMRFFPDGRYLAAIDSYGNLSIWDFKERKLAARAEKQRDAFYSLDISDDGTMVVTAGIAGNLILWRVNLPPEEK
jgi:WD40 repeat protein